MYGASKKALSKLLDLAAIPETPKKIGLSSVGYTMQALEQHRSALDSSTKTKAATNQIFTNESISEIGDIIAKTRKYVQNHAIPISGDELTKAEYILNFNTEKGGRSLEEGIREITGAKMRDSMYLCYLPKGSKVIKYTTRDFTQEEMDKKTSAGGFTSIDINDSPADVGLNPEKQYYAYVAEATQDIPVIVEKCASIRDWKDQNMVNPGGSYALRVPRGSFTLIDKLGTSHIIPSKNRYPANPEDIKVNLALQRKLQGDNSIDIINPKDIEQLKLEAKPEKPSEPESPKLLG